MWSIFSVHRSPKGGEVLDKVKDFTYLTECLEFMIYQGVRDWHVTGTMRAGQRNKAFVLETMELEADHNGHHYLIMCPPKE